MGVPVALGAAGRAVLDLLLPPLCLTCDRPVDGVGRFCPDCFRRTAFVTEPLCVACGEPFRAAREGGAAPVCAACSLRPPPWQRARGALRYDGQTQRIVLALKYADRTELAAPLAALMARAGAALLAAAELIAPVPLHRRRLFARRYNQAALLALALGRIGGRPVVPDLLARPRHTRPLGHLGAAARAVAMEGAVVVRPHRAARVAGRRVLLVDDVMTSGSTARACTEALLGAGAAAVDVLVAARVAHPHPA
jgi:predicted amidophosphoribosyltransferase